MKLALKQAMINLGNTAENPSVGCVITKNNTNIENEVRKEVVDLCSKFPIYKNLK